MPHRDPRFNPALKRALPADHAGGGWSMRVSDVWEVKFGNGKWRLARVRMWHRSRDGRDLVSMEWSTPPPDPATYGDWFYADPERMREFEDEPAEWSPWRRE